MDPKLMALLQQMHAQKSGDGQPASQDPTAGQDQGGDPFGGKFEHNPFEGIVPGMNPSVQAQPAQQQAPQAGGPMGAAQADPKMNQLNPGSNPGGTKYLVAALQQLQGYVAEATNPDEIMTIRSVIKLLTGIINADQEKQMSNLGGQGGAPTAQQGQ